MNRTRFTFVCAVLSLGCGLAVAGCAPEKAPDTPEGKAQYQAPMASMQKRYGGGGQPAAGGGGAAPAPAGQPAPPGPPGAR